MKVSMKVVVIFGENLFGNYVHSDVPCILHSFGVC